MESKVSYGLFIRQQSGRLPIARLAPYFGGVRLVLSADETAIRRIAMSSWWKFWERRKIEAPQDLAEHLATEADELTQRTIVYYTQALVGREWRRLVATDEFRAALHKSRWESYPAILGDLVCIVESYSRGSPPRDANDRAALFQRLFANALAARPIPVDHAGDAQPAIDRFPVELARRLLAEPQTSGRIAKSGGKYLFDHLPIHESARETHKLPVVNAVRFAMVGFRDSLERKIANPTVLLRRLTEEMTPGDADFPKPPAP
jgi:hypothetical protein